MPQFRTRKGSKISALKADILKALNRQDEAKTTWNKALEKAKAPQSLYVWSTAAESEKGAEAMEIFKEVAKRFPNGVFGYLAQARIKSAAGDFAGALSDAETGASCRS